MSTTSNDRGLAIVTGASAGLGQSFARELARRGYDLLLVARRQDRLVALCEELRKEHGRRAEPLAADLSHPEGPAAVIEAMDAGECPTLLVNNAGFGHAGRALDAPTERSVEMLRLNVEAVTRLTLEAARRMVGAGRGGIINVSSTAAFAGSPYFAVYGATKGFQLLFSEALDQELRGTGVRVFALCPGYTATDFHDVSGLQGKPPASMIATPEQCVRDGLDAYERGGSSYVHGSLNKVSVFVQRLLPRSAVVGAAAKMFAPK